MTLVEKTKQKSTNYFTLNSEGISVAHYQDITVSKKIGNKTRTWIISRSEASRIFTKHYICCETTSDFSEERRSRLYDTDAAFEAAINRIEKQLNTI